MGVWFKVDVGALNDWRIRALAEQIGVSYGDAYYLCSLLWAHLNERGSGPIASREVDAVANTPGFAALLVEVTLADELGEGVVRIHGERRVGLEKHRQAQRDRINLRWARERERRAEREAEVERQLRAADDAGNGAGVNLCRGESEVQSGQTRSDTGGNTAGIQPVYRRYPEGLQECHSSPTDIPAVIPGNTRVEIRSDPDPESLFSSSSSLREEDSENIHSRARAPEVVLEEPSQPSWERQTTMPGVPVIPIAGARLTLQAKVEADKWLVWFNREFDRRFQVRPQLLADVRKLLAAGFDQRDMRKVALFKQDQWKGEMAAHLVPSTLLRPSKFGGYLDEAKSVMFRDEDDPQLRGGPNGGAKN